MRLGRKRRCSRLNSRRRRKNYIPLVFLLVVFVFFFWVIFQFVASVFSNIRSETVSAELQILSGKAEYLLPETTDWNLAFSEQAFLAGDRIRTGNDSKISFDFFGGSTLFMNENSELEFIELEKKASGKKTVRLKLLSGQVWTKVSDDDFSKEKNSTFEIETQKTKLYVNGTIFDFATVEQQDSIRLIKGSVVVDLFKDETLVQNISVGVGQKLVVNDQVIEALKNNEERLEIIDSEFINSEWHLQNLEKFFPQEVVQIRRKIELSQAQKATLEEVKNQELSVGDQSLASPEILSPQNGSKVPASQDMIKLEGTAPVEAYQIEINGYLLTKFNPGDKKWTYFGAKKFGTLVSGENVYKIVAIARDGRRSVPTEVTIFYEGGSEDLESKELNRPTISESINSFSAPVVYRPSVFLSDQTKVYQTSASIVTIAGNVDPKTNAVKINDFRLKKFVPGNTEFSYIANANYGNMKEGENIYTIVAFGPDGKESKTIIKIHYTPVELGR